MKTAQRFTFRALGSGKFPLDMLRYDSCWPKSQSDVREIDRWTGIGEGERGVLLEGVRTPTVERWASFGWRVDAVEKVS